jgi:major membrane immunogen (membrane-anchored lipoprotein)
MLGALLILVAVSVANVLSRPDGAQPGGFQPMNQADPQVKEQVQNLTKFAVKTLDAKANDQYHSQLVRVSDAQYQFAQGVNYRITFYIGQSKCQRDKDGNSKFDAGTCSLKDDGTYQTCTVTIWEKKWEDFLNITDSSCTIVSKEEALSANSLPGPGGAVAGGYQPMDQSDPKVKQQVQNLTQFAVKTLDAKANDQYHNQLVRVSDAQYQTVQGTNYKITFYIGQSQCQRNKDGNSKYNAETCSLKDDGTYQLCTVTLWEKTWEHVLNVTESNCTKVTKDEAVASNVLPRLGAVPAGGFQSMNQSDPKVKQQVQNLTNFAVKSLDAKANDQYHSQLVRVSDAQYQTVQGTKYRITFYIGQSKCQRDKDGNSKFDAGTCSLKDDGTYQTCTVTIWEKTWENFLNITDSNCTKVSKEESSSANGLPGPGGAVAGGYQPMDQSDPKVKQQVQNLTKLAVKTMDDKANDQYHNQLVRVSDTQYQIVQGTNYKITFYVGQSQCKRNKDDNSKFEAGTCKLKDDGQYQKCTATIWEKQWENFLKVTDSSCSKVSKAEALKNN